MVVAKVPETRMPEVQGTIRETATGLSVVDRGTRNAVRAEVTDIVEDVQSDAKAGNKSASREGLFQLLDLSKSRVRANIRAERLRTKGAKEIKISKEHNRGRRWGGKVEAKARAQAEVKMKQGETAEDKCIGVDTLLALDRRRLTEITEDIMTITENVLPHQNNEGRKNFQQQIATLQEKKVQTLASIQKLKEERGKLTKDIDVSDKVVEFVKDITNRQDPEIDSNPLVVLESFLTSKASTADGQKELQEIVKKKLPEIDIEEDLEKIMNPPDYDKTKKRSLLALLLLLAGPIIAMKQAAKSEMNQTQMR